jgi:hypothetical protein
MQLTFIGIISAIAAILVGGVMGYGFGLIQRSARSKNERLQESGKLNNGWAVMPGSGRRVAYLLICLAGVQFICPMLFVNGIQWWVSAGVVGGYGVVLYQQLRQRMSEKKAIR